MKKKHLLFTTLALSLGTFTGGSGAMAQTSWDYVYTQEETNSVTWTALTEGSTTGKTLGGSGTTSYYRLTKSLNFTNTTAGGSGLTILGTVYLYLPAGVNITCVGHDAVESTGAGAGIELTESNTLYIIGGGNGATVTATGGNAANGGNGGNGQDAAIIGGWDTCSGVAVGGGGAGGNGGGGAGAGIGSRGGNGGAGGSAEGMEWFYSTFGVKGADGGSGSAGTSAQSMGQLFVVNGFTVNATGGSKGSAGTAGSAGKSCMRYGGNEYSVTGGGGGGAGGFGGAAANIGTGGPGGGGGGGGAKGSQDRKSTGYYGFESVGGRGGTNGDGTYANDGGETRVSWQAITDGICLTNAQNSWLAEATQVWRDDLDSKGGSRGGTGNASAAGMMNSDEKTYTITLQPTKTKVNGSNLDAVNMTYTPSTLTTFILPKNKSGYQWALLVYGKSCKADGTAGSVFTTATKEFFGGEETDDALRTIVLNDVYGDMTFVEVATTCKLKSSGDNSETLTDFFYNEAIMSQKYPVTVRLQNRTLYTDDKYNTLCLPFGMTPSQFDISILQGATIYEMNTTATGYYPDGTQIPDAMYRKEGPVLYLKFDLVNASTNGLEAGKPYLVKWTSGSNFVDNTSDGNTRHEVDFYNVTVTKLAPQAPAANGVTFQGTFSSSATLTAYDKTKLILGADNKLYYPSKNINVGACRAYFIIPAAAASAREMVLSFDDEMTTAIQTPKLNNGSKDSDNFFNLNGQRLSAPKKGINIVNGKKVLVK